MGIVKFHAVESGTPGAHGGIGEQAGQHGGQFLYMGQMEIGHPLPVSQVEILHFPFIQYFPESGLIKPRQISPDPFIRPVRLPYQLPVPAGELQVFMKIDIPPRPPADGEEIYQLYKQPGVSPARPLHDIRQRL